jgi:glycosyltransferase involved in cell wall biosynthesis
MNNILFIANDDWYIKSHRSDLLKRAKLYFSNVGILANLTNKKKLFKDIKVYDWKMNKKSINFFKILFDVNKINDAISNFSPNLIHCIGMKPIILMSILNFFINKKTIYAFTGFGILDSKYFLRYKLMKKIFFFFFKYFTKNKKFRIIVQNTENKHYLINLGILRKNIKLIHGTGFTFSKKKNYKYSKKKIILFAGRLLWSKGVKEFIECSNSKYLKDKDIQFLLAGKPDLGSIDAFPVEYLESNKNKNFVWLKKQKTLDGLLKKSYLFLYPSTYGEGTPRVVLESFKYSVPVIAFKNPGCNDIIKNNYNGFLIEPMNTNKMIKKINYLLENKVLRNKLGKNASKYLFKNFSNKKIFADTYKVWKNLYDK